MAIPSLDKRGLLPPGVYDCTIDEIGAAFSAPDPAHKRAMLFERFRNFVEWTKSVKWVKLVYVDGSFITDKANPGDVDVTIELPAASLEVQKVLTGNLVFNRDHMKNTFSVHIFPTIPGLPSEDYREFFQLLKPEEAHKRRLKAGSKKGILRITL